MVRKVDVKISNYCVVASIFPQAFLAVALYIFMLFHLVPIWYLVISRFDVVITWSLYNVHICLIKFFSLSTYLLYKYGYWHILGLMSF